MASKQAQAVVIGAGPGGYVAAIRLAQLGVKTIVVERAHLGGVCLNYGCIPSKAVIHAADLFHEIGQLGELGITVKGLDLDMVKLRDWNAGIVHKLTSGIGGLLKANGVEVLMGSARVATPGKVVVDTGNGASTEIVTENIIIATGSRPIEIPGFAFDGERVLGSKDVFQLDTLPKRVLVIGGGYIGLELGTALRKLGAEVTVAEMMDRVLATMEKDLTKVVERRLKKLGVVVRTQTKALGYAVTKAGLEVRIETAKGEETLVVDRIVSAVGMRPNTEGLGLAEVGVEIDKRGFIAIDAQRQTRVKGIFAIGDAAGGVLLAHKASKEGVVAAEAIAGKPAAYDVVAMPWVVFTDPEIAGVGLSQQEAKDAGYNVSVGKFQYSGSGRAMTMAAAEGFVKMVVDADTDIVLGIQMVGKHASEMLGEAALAIEMCATAEDVALTVHAHPTLPEMVMEAAEAVHGLAIHVPPVRKKGGAKKGTGARA
jgi:dihydrolipoamide dehydrogenase